MKTNARYKEQSQVITDFNKQSKVKKNDISNVLESIIKLGNSKIKNESIDVVVNLNTDAKQTNQNIKTSILFPHAINKTPKILLFTEKKVSHNNIIIGNKIYIDDIIKAKKCKFDLCISNEDNMKTIKKAARILKGKLPNDKQNTLVTDNEIAKISLEYANGNRIMIKNDQNRVNLSIGHINMKLEHLIDNLSALLKQLEMHKPKNLKTGLFKGVTFSTTQGHFSIFVPIKNLNNLF